MSDIGCRSFLISFTGFCFGRGVTSANFQMLGRRCSLKAFSITETGYARNSAYSLNKQLGIPSGRRIEMGKSLVDVLLCHN